MTKSVRPTQHNSTLPARTQPIARSSRSLRSAGTPPKKKPVKKVNTERQKKRAAAYRKGLVAYRKSETAKFVRERAGGRCENLRPAGYVGFFGGVSLDVVVRCDATEGLQDHHLSYTRFGGRELPEDMLRVCTPCHRYLESQKPAGNRYTRSRTHTGD